MYHQVSSKDIESAEERYYKEEHLPKDIQYITFSYLDPKYLIQKISRLSQTIREGICKSKCLDQEKVFYLKFPTKIKPKTMKYCLRLCTKVSLLFKTFKSLDEYIFETILDTCPEKIDKLIKFECGKEDQVFDWALVQKTLKQKYKQMFGKYKFELFVECCSSNLRSQIKHFNEVHAYGIHMDD